MYISDLVCFGCLFKTGLCLKECERGCESISGIPRNAVAMGDFPASGLIVLATGAGAAFAQVNP